MTTKVICDTCEKEFETKITDPKVLKNKAFCSDNCWVNNKGNHE